MQIFTLKPFYLMRHAHSADNARQIISGSGSDPDLTDIGRAQAELARHVFAALSPQPGRIIVSTLKRTHQTAQIVVGHSDFIIDSDLNERYLGELDGKITEDRQKEMKILPGEELQDAHRERVIRAINRHLEGDDIPFFICHAGTIRRILEVTGLREARVANAKIYRFAPVDSGWAILE
jgi:broad specificity phosphatase PhoE